jgi:hypothetical protein
VTILETQEISLKNPSIFDSIIATLYKVDLADPGWLSEDNAGRFAEVNSFPVFWPRKEKEIDLKKFVESFSRVSDRTLQVGVYSRPEGIMRPEEVLDFIFRWAEGKRPAISVQKIQVRFKESYPCPMKS